MWSNRSHYSNLSFVSKPESSKLIQKSSEDIHDKSLNFPTGEDFFWSKEYLQVMDLNLDEMFKDVYQDLFVDKIFGLNETYISRTTFITAITAQINGIKKADWIFKTKQLRTRFHENLDLIKVKEEIYTTNIDHD